MFQFRFRRLTKKETAFLVAGIIAIFVLWNFASFTTAFFWTVFLVWLIPKLDSRILASVALAFLIGIPILHALDQEARAEQFAVYVYFLLVITVVLQIAEYRRDIKKKSETPEPIIQQMPRSFIRRKAPQPVPQFSPTRERKITPLEPLQRPVSPREMSDMVPRTRNRAPHVIDLRHLKS